MKTPTLEEVKEYFKYAETIQDHSGDIGFPESNKFKFTQLRTGIVQNIDKKNWLVLWHEKKGYAKILTYKTPKFEITKETVIKYQMKDEFPEVFEVELKVGRWYKSTTSKSFVFVEKILRDEVFGYGFNYIGKYFNDDIGWAISMEKFMEATTEEVTEALINEAVMRGYKEGVYFKVPNSETISVCKYKMSLNPMNNSILYYGDYCIFKDGSWATIIETITKQEAEKKLKCKIVD